MTKTQEQLAQELEQHRDRGTGQFGEHGHSAAETKPGEVTIPTEAQLAALENNAASVVQMAATMTAYRLNNLTDLTRAELQVASGGQAKTLIISHSWDDEKDAFHVTQIIGLDGTILFDEDNAYEDNIIKQTPVNKIDRRLIEFGTDDASTYFEYHSEDPEGGSDNLSLDLTVSVTPKNYSVGDALGIDDMNVHEVNGIMAATAYRLGQVGGYMDRTEVHYRLIENPEPYGFDRTRIEELVEKAGGEDQFIQQVIETSSWASNLDDQVSDLTTTAVTEALGYAIDEIATNQL
ncbi:hypothetical protein [Leifsonia sp. Leaf264]|uniref:hypothetical protein n=1 Tax=Leifsonia sp. Leaf264 TaxID=1736314 RepID=UPI0006F2C077|nr:hypothetical protein [Leifsonia sp. Leaf264]KQO98151.1 hypothetical protein ASF30_08815 [Leifsonia sp. Leaf264]